MRAGAFFWMMLLGNAAMLALTWGVSIWAGLGLAVALPLLWRARIHGLFVMAESLSRGDLNAAIPVSGSDEVATLAKSMERMRTRLARQVETILRQRVTLESLVAQLDEGVVVADGDGRIVLVNPAAARLLSFRGAATGEIILDSQHRVESLVASHDLQRMLLRDEQESDSPSEKESTAGDMQENLHLRAIRLDVPDSPSPTYVLARACSIPIALPSGRPASASEGAVRGRLLVLTDVTALMRAIRSRSDFVANASHELRTPVAAIRVAVGTLMKVNFALEAPDALRFANIIARQAARLEALVTDLLDLAKVESPGARIEPSKIFLQRAVDELRGRWEQELSDKGLGWTAEVMAEASEVQANDHLLSLVLDNLVDNAIKFTPSGGQIALRTWASGDRIVLEVSDTGCGIALSDQQRVFERFYQVDAVRTGTGSDKRGTGLGLSIVRHAVSAMGGTVSLTSEMGQGTRVIVGLPRS